MTETPESEFPAVISPPSLHVIEHCASKNSVRAFINPGVERMCSTMPGERDQAGTSRPLIVREICLHTEQAQRVYKRCFRQLNHHAFSISVITRSHGHEQQARDAEREVRSLFGELRAELETEIARLQKLFDELELLDEGNCSRPGQYRVEISSRMAFDYLQVLCLMDRYLGLFEILVILGEIDYQQRQSVTHSWQQKLTRLARRVRAVADELRHFHRQNSVTGKDGQQTTGDRK